MKFPRTHCLLIRLVPCGAALLMLALVMRHLWRDEFIWSAPTFYALPLPLHVAGWLFLCWWWWKPVRIRDQRSGNGRDWTRWLVPVAGYSIPAVLGVMGWYATAAVGALVITALMVLDLKKPPPAVIVSRVPNRRLAWLCAAGVVCSSVLWWMNTARLRGESAAGPGDGPRVLWWNIGHTHKVPAALHELIRDLKPDMIGLAESENLEAEGFAELKKEHPGYQAVEFTQGVSCLVLGSFPAPVSRKLAPRVAVNLVTASFTRLPGEWKLCLTDIPPVPPFPRAEYLDEIRHLAGNGPRTIIAADFNTPLDSAGFDAWRENYHHGFADCAAWKGPLETWGFGIPILAIDHIWMSHDFSPRAARKEVRLFQDHSWLFVEWAPTER